MSIRLGQQDSSKRFSNVTKKLYHSKLLSEDHRFQQYLVINMGHGQWWDADAYTDVNRSWRKWQLHLISRWHENV
jgi:hypothetical protein